MLEEQFFLCASCALNILYVIIGNRIEPLHSTIFTSAGVAATTATFGALLLSMLGAKRSILPSSLLEIYYAILSITYLPRLRSLWLTPHVDIPRNIWTANYTLTVFIAILESCGEGIYQLFSSKLKYAREETFGFWGRGLFFWVLLTLRRGYSSTLHTEDIPPVDIPLQGHESRYQLQEAWNWCRPRHRLLKAVFSAYAWDIAKCVPAGLITSGLTMCQPFLIEAAVGLSEKRSSEVVQEYRKALIGGFVLVYVGMALSTAVYGRLVNRVMALTRASLISIIYHRTAESNKYNLSDSRAITLIGTDVECICTSFKSFHTCWISVLEIAASICLLERQVGVTCVVPTVISIVLSSKVSMLSIIPIANNIVPAQKAWVVGVQRRMRTTLTMLGNMKVIKMLGLSESLHTRISGLREAELKTSEVFRKLLVWTITLSNLPAELAPFATFAVYTIVSLITHDSSLLASRAFTSLSLISILTSRLVSFIQSLPQFARCLGCLDRIDVYLLESYQDVEANAQSNKRTLSPSAKAIMDQASDQSMLMKRPRSSDDVSPSTGNFDNLWTAKSDYIFQILNVTIKKGFTVIFGPSGSGKTTLLERMLNNNPTEGILGMSTSAVAYCAEVPWIINDTIRHNIIGPNGHYEETWYKSCLSMTALITDLEGLPTGDLYLAGNNGIALSEGQKKRVALARALYSRLPLLMLDDVWSGLDAKNINLIQRNLFGADGYFRQAGISVIMTSHTIPSFADQVLILQGGSIVDTGSYQDVISRAPELINGTSLDKLQSMDVLSDEHKIDIELLQSVAEAKPKQTPTAYQENCRTEAVSNKDSAWSTYRYYIKQAGRWKPPLFLISCLASAFLANYVTIWIQRWAEANSKRPNANPGFYLGVYAALIVLHVLFFVACCYFFQKTDSGATANRFNQDMDLIDMKLPMSAIGFTGVGKYFAIIVPLLLLLIWLIQRYYLRTSRQMRLLEIEAKSPIYTHVNETIAGISTIKAYCWQNQFQQACDEHINYSQRTYYMLLSIQQWLTLVLDLLVALMAVFLVVITTCFHNSFSAGEIGVALNIVLTFNDALAQAITSWTQLETSIGAVTRVQQFRDNTPTEHRHSNTPAALTNINLKIKPSEKLAICGPSGSGKTSLILALLQMIEVRSGSISIDDRDLLSLQPDDIRSEINVVPQDPLFIPGSVEYNLNFTKSTTDVVIESALRKVGLWDKILYGGGLHADLEPNDWSAGEKRLFALARALINESRIVILDEVISSVDPATERIMQRVIDERFSDRTVIAIMHRLAHIDRFDRVAVLEKSEIIECDTPAALLTRDSKFRELYAASLEQSL
ncbi:hypothetical protein N7478_009692 [Penicillium angulare]|uniref:uncharacterized protein n=1 Tax=Penicillium angulare TaxID=116970 RepID=UPI00253FEABE|nr:uncharacterized protein N7478_009692 [Penicillium angulare]KAJ5266884.1 hypothetical protein N7478_009692 [Penicillium angulare]